MGVPWVPFSIWELDLLGDIAVESMPSAAKPRTASCRGLDSGGS